MSRSSLLLAFACCLDPANSTFLIVSRTPSRAVRPVAPRAAVSATLSDNFRIAGAAALASAVLLASPGAAMAKGGGHSSSHSSSSHSSSHSSSSHSSSRSSPPLHGPSRSSSYSSPRSSSSRSSSSYSSSYSSPSRSSRSRSSVPRSYSPKTTTARPSSSKSRSRSKSGRSRSRTSSGSGSGSTYSYPRTRTRTVYTSPTYSSPTTYYDYDYDAPSTVYTSPEPVEVFPQSATDKAFHDGLWAARLEAVVIAGGLYSLYDTVKPGFDGDDEGEDDGIVFEEEHRTTDPLVAAIARPSDGRYEGRSAEDDDGDQSVVTHLTFLPNGTVKGWGEDGVDGRYVIKDGVWSTGGEGIAGGRVAWIEKYDEGFEVALRGQIRADGAIRALWASSVGVGGS